MSLGRAAFGSGEVRCACAGEAVTLVGGVAFLTDDVGVVLLDVEGDGPPCTLLLLSLFPEGDGVPLLLVPDFAANFCAGRTARGSDGKRGDIKWLQARGLSLDSPVSYCEASRSTRRARKASECSPLRSYSASPARPCLANHTIHRPSPRTRAVAGALRPMSLSHDAP